MKVDHHGTWRLLWTVSSLFVFLVGCSTVNRPKPNISYRETVGEDRVSVFAISIYGTEFKLKSPTGFVEFFESPDHSVVKVNVSSDDSIGSYVGGEIGNYYYIPVDGDVRYLGSLRESWYEDEARVRFRMGKLIPVEVPKR
jgi:hypothetical protein